MVVAITVARVKAIISSGMVVKAKVIIKEAAQVVAIALTVVAKVVALMAAVAVVVLVVRATAVVAEVEVTLAIRRSNRNMQ